jgi:hypothetical protein
LAATRDWRYGRFLLVAVDERITPPSGCSIDALNAVLRKLERELDMEVLAGGSVWFRDERAGGDPCRTTREEFGRRVKAGEVTKDTVVFDLSVTRVREAREGGWETPARDSWHRRYFR